MYMLLCKLVCCCLYPYSGWVTPSNIFTNLIIYKLYSSCIMILFSITTYKTDQVDKKLAIIQTTP